MMTYEEITQSRIENGFTIDFEGHKTKYMYSPDRHTELANHAINKLGCDIALLYRSSKMKESGMSHCVEYFIYLYSRTADVGEIARKYGGSGDKAKAQFIFSSDKMLEFVDSKL